MGLLSSKDIEYQQYTLGDIGVIELLIVYRYKYDDNIFLDDSIPMAVSGAARVNEEVIYTYASLDQTIARCNFNEQQKEMIRLIGEGYSQSEIAFELGLHQSTISGRLQTIYKKIYKENEWLWRKCVYEDKLELKNKICSKCKEEMPATPEFYSDLHKSKDGFHSQCRKCKY
ncbi:helix-turn-helix transcriptional regulator [Sporosarcina sp. FSL W7-1283]|uniref:helix-turn-helix transcriptional regulator n=1 Tax=Sporosarcina sp. FSL W7-1283 TaxID=2921560 RepID=UPI0030F5AC53